jgi:putative addiction module component (TIGR02574 family)
MSVTMKSLGLDQLSIDERRALAEELWASIAAETGGPGLTDEQKRELDRRIAEDEADPDSAIPWEQVKAEMLARVKQVRG